MMESALPFASKCGSIVFSGHAVRRMFARKINETDVKQVVENGEVIAEYLDDDPFPSFLVLGFANQRPLHIVVGVDKENEFCHIVTAYDPDPIAWSDDFRTRRTS